MPLFPRTRQRAWAALAGFSLLGLAACGGAATTTASPSSTTMQMPATTTPSTPAPAVATNAVSILNFAFSPSVVTVKAGTTITWTNKDEEPHTVTFTALGTRSPNLTGAAAVYSQTFAQPGTYAYHCSIHPFMHGTVVVTA